MNNYRIEKSKDYLDILIINDKFINSKFNPSAEANNVIYSGKNLICIFGLGLGYGLHNILNNNKNSLVIVFEPVEEILILYKEKYTDNEILYDRAVLFLNKIDKEKIYTFIEETNFFSEGRIYYYSNLGYKSIFPEIETLFYSSVKESFNIVTQNILTESNFIPMWTKNFIFNSLKFIDNPIVKPVKTEQNQNIGIIACAGPNLIYDIPVIKKHRDKITIFAVDTAIKPLIRNGINPDFVVSLDGQFYSFEDFTKESNDETLYIFDILSYPPAARLSKNVFFTVTKNVLQNSIIEYFFDGNNIEKFGIFTGGTVSDYTLSFALSLGFTKIYFAGLDLSFPYLLTHSKFSPYHERILNNQTYFETPETNIVKAISKRKIKESKSKIQEKKLISDFVLENYGLYIESFIRGNNLQNIFNSSYHGLQIEGLKNIDLDILISTTSSNRVNNSVLLEKSKFFNCSKDSLNAFYNKLLNDLYDFSIELKDLIDNTDFESTNSDLLNRCRDIHDSNFKKFPFLNKFVLMTRIILDKKNITQTSLIYYKHVFYKLIQSIYYLIRIIQKFEKII